MITDYILMFGLKILPNNLSDVRLAGMVELELMESQQIIINNNQEPVFLLCQQDQTSAVMQIMIPVHNDRPPPTPLCASCACASCACEVTSGQMEPTDNCWLQACDSGKQRGDNPLSGICANGDLGIIMVDGSEPQGLSTSGHILYIWHLTWCSTSYVPEYLSQNKKGLTHLGSNNESQISNRVVVGKYRQKISGMRFLL